MAETHLEREAGDLRTIKMRWAAPHCYMRPSILEQPCGDGRGILDAIEWLQSSALDWGSVNFRDEGYTWELKKLYEVAKEALDYFEEFRTIACRPPLTILDPGAGVRWYDQYDRIPAEVHRQVYRIQWQMRTTSLYSLEDAPDIDTLERAGIWAIPPLRKCHLAAIAALACSAHAINDLTGVLEFWRELFRQRARAAVPVHFDGNHGEPEWEDALLKMREDASNLRIETERRRDAFAWIGRAKAWIAHARHVESTEWKIRAAAQVAAVEASERATLEAARKERQKRSEAARNSQSERKKKKAETRQRVDAAWQALQKTQQDRNGVSLVHKKVGISAKQVRRHLRELGHLN